MAKLKEHISVITQVLSNGPVSDDFQFPDQMIYFILKDLRAKMLKQKIDAGKYVNPQNYQTIPCYKLNYDDLVDCECYTADCKGLQSVCNLPRIISSNKGLWVDGVYTINSNKPSRLDNVTLDEVRLSEYSKTMQNVKGWFIHKDKMYVTGYDRLAAVRVTALFEDPLAIMNMSPSCGCNPDGSALCVDPYEAEFPLDADMTRDLRTMTYEELLKIGMIVPRDVTNDALAGPQLAMPRQRKSDDA